MYRIKSKKGSIKINDLNIVVDDKKWVYLTLKQIKGSKDLMDNKNKLLLQSKVDEKKEVIKTVQNTFNHITDTTAVYDGEANKTVILDKTPKEEVKDIINTVEKEVVNEVKDMAKDTEKKVENEQKVDHIEVTAEKSAVVTNKTDTTEKTEKKTETTVEDTEKENKTTKEINKKISDISKLENAAKKRGRKPKNAE